MHSGADAKQDKSYDKNSVVVDPALLLNPTGTLAVAVSLGLIREQRLARSLPQLGLGDEGFSLNLQNFFFGLEPISELRA